MQFSIFRHGTHERWHSGHSTWKDAFQDSTSLAGRAGERIGKGLKFLTDLVTAIVMGAFAGLAGIAGLVAVPAVIFLAACAVVLAISGTIVALGAVLEFFGLG